MLISLQFIGEYFFGMFELPPLLNIDIFQLTGDTYQILVSLSWNQSSHNW